MLRKIKVKKRLTSPLELEGSVEEVIIILQNMKKEHEREGWSDLELETKFDYYDESSDLVLSGYREETDAEYNKRIKKMAGEKEKKRKDQEKKKEREITTLKRLAKKYPKQISGKQE